jgi:hypothetical protein
MRSLSSPFAPLALLAALCVSLAAGAAHAQSTTVSCTSYTTPCVLPSGGIIIGGLPGMPSEVTSNSAGTYGFGKTIIGSLNLIQDLNTATDLDPSGNEATLMQSQIFGDVNSLSAKSAYNSITGYNNSAWGNLGNLQIVGSSNQVISDDDKITVSGTHNIVSGTQGQHRSLTISGVDNTADTSSGTYSGRSNTVRNATDSSITGVDNTVESADSSSVTGTGNTLSGQDNSIVGTGNTLSATSNSSITGVFNTLSGNSNSITGASNTLSGTFNSLTGVGNKLSGTNSAILGSFSSLSGTNGEMIVGSNSHLGPDAKGTIILGSGITSDRPNAAEFGGRVLSGVGDGIELQDGVTVNQLNRVMAGYGGGASLLGGIYVPPSYTFISGATYTNVGSALADLDGRVNTLETAPSGSGVPGPVGPTGPQGPKGDPGQDGKDATGGNSTDALAVHYDDASQSQVTLAGADGTTISNVKAGVAETDAANVGQVQQAINTANSYTDNQVNIAKDWAKTYTDAQAAHTLHDANAYTDMRFGQIGDRISRIAALSSASSNLASNYRNTPNSIAAGLGWSGGHNALSVGFRHVSHDGRMSWSVSGGVSGSERTVGMGIGYGW